MQLCKQTKKSSFYHRQPPLLCPTSTDQCKEKALKYSQFTEVETRKCKVTWKYWTYLEVDGCPRPSFNLLRLSLLLGEKFLKFLQFFFLRRRWNFSPQQRCRSPAAAQVRHEICEIFKIFNFTQKMPLEFRNCDIFGKILRILEVLLIYLDQIVCFCAIICSNANWLRLLCEGSSLNSANFTYRVI